MQIMQFFIFFVCIHKTKAEFNIRHGLHELQFKQNRV